MQNEERLLLLHGCILLLPSMVFKRSFNQGVIFIVVDVQEVYAFKASEDYEGVEFCIEQWQDTEVAISQYLIALLVICLNDSPIFQKQ